MCCPVLISRGSPKRWLTIYTRARTHTDTHISLWTTSHRSCYYPLFDACCVSKIDDVDDNMDEIILSFVYQHSLLIEPIFWDHILKYFLWYPYYASYRLIKIKNNTTCDISWYCFIIKLIWQKLSIKENHIKKRVQYDIKFGCSRREILSMTPT